MKQTKPPRTEREIQDAILALNRTIPGLHLFKVGSGAFRVGGRFVRMGQKGLPDMVGWISQQLMVGGIRTNQVFARFVAVEAKRPGQKATPEQWAFLNAVKDAGGIALVAHSAADVVQALA